MVLLVSMYNLFIVDIVDIDVIQKFLRLFRIRFVEQFIHIDIIRVIER